MMKKHTRNTNPLNSNNLFNPTDTIDIEYGIECVIDLFDSDEFESINSFDEDEVDTERQIDICDWKTCPNCSTIMEPMITSYRCPKCGLDSTLVDQTSDFSTTVKDNYNSNEMCAQSIKVVGKSDVRKYQKGLLSTSSDYSKVQSNNTARQLARANSQSKYGQLPIIILKEASELYGQIQKFKIVKRGNKRQGALGACIAFICNFHGITKKTSILAKIMRIKESYISGGDNLLRQLYWEGKIDIPVNHDPKNDFIFRFFEVLDIDCKYKPFISEIIDITRENNDLIGENNCTTSTKCAGAIYLLTKLFPDVLVFTDKALSDACDEISVTTFRRYFRFIESNMELLKPTFDKHRMPYIQLKEKKKKKAIKEPKVKAVKEPKVKAIKEPKVKVVKEPKVKAIKEPKVKVVKEPKVKAIKEPKVKTVKVKKSKVKESTEEREEKINT
jgi:hypothetical protein